MNVFMFSSLMTNSKIRRTIPKLLGDNKTIAFIPASYMSTAVLYDGRTYYEMGFRRGLSFPIGREYNAEHEEQLFDSAAIHIGGGNTFELLYMLREKGLIPKLQEYVKNGGILMGNSAGSIVMCPTIEIAQFADENNVYLSKREQRSLALVDFDMKPHWESWERYRVLFEDFAEEHKRKLYCLCENQAIHVSDHGIEFFGGKPVSFGG